MNRDPKTTIRRQTWNIRCHHRQLPKGSLGLVERGTDECIIQKVRRLCRNQLAVFYGHSKIGTRQTSSSGHKALGAKLLDGSLGDAGEEKDVPIVVSHADASLEGLDRKSVV